ncbi:MAG: GTP-binding protein [Candidatus Thermoplasmatota archaeon]|nr:GTP-binding protein [Candidatus Thermoplasmatota archaeon]
MVEQEKMKVKICLVGEGAVGKTCLIRRFVHDEFEDRYISTLGAKVSKREIIVDGANGGEVAVDMTIWDIMGEKGFRELLKEAYFHGAQGVLAVCDLTRRDTLYDLHDWVKAVNKVTGDIPVQFLANKKDLADQRSFEDKEMESVAAKYNSAFLSTSAKTGDNVSEAFEKLARMIAKRLVPQ